MHGWTPEWAACLRVDVPAGASPRIVFEATTAVEPIVAAVERSATACLNVAITARAIEAFERHGDGRLLERLRILSTQRRIEILGTAADDAILPLLPEREVRRQLRLNDEAGQRAFGDAWQPRVLWPPSLATSPRLSRVAADMEYAGMLVDECALRCSPGAWDGERIDSSAGTPGFWLFPVTRRGSAAFAKGLVRREDGWRGLGLAEVLRQRYAITTFHPDQPTRRPRLVVAPEDLEIAVRLGDLLHKYSLSTQTAPLPSSARTSLAALQAGMPFVRWYAPDDPIHALQWRLALRMLQAVERLEQAGLHPHPGVGALRRAVDHGWSKDWWEAASQEPRDDDAIIEGLRRREEAIAGVRELLPEDVHRALVDAVGSLHERLGGVSLFTTPAEELQPRV